MKREYDSDKSPEEVKAQLQERTRPYHFVIWADPNVWLLLERKDGTVRIIEEATAKYWVAADLRIMPTARGSCITVDVQNNWFIWLGNSALVLIMLLYFAVKRGGMDILVVGMTILIALYLGLYIPLRMKKKEKELLALIEGVAEE